MLQGGGKKETPELSCGINHCCATSRTRDRGELSATRDVISANEIANRVNWRRGPRWHAAATGIKYREKVLVCISRRAILTGRGGATVQLCDALNFQRYRREITMSPLDYNLAARRDTQIDRLPLPLSAHLSFSLSRAYRARLSTYVIYTASCVSRIRIHTHTHVAEYGRT